MKKYFKSFISAGIALTMVFSLNSNVFAYNVPTKINIGLTRLGSQSSFSVSNTGIEINGDDYYSRNGFGVIAEGNTIYVYDGDSNEIAKFSGQTDKIYAVDKEYIRVSGSDYRDSLFFVATGGKMTAVNALESVEEYLYSVVPSEMPSSWEAEALKAQAVAARTYTVTRMGVHASNGYDLCDSTHCQVFKGVAGEAVASTKAVDKTAGQIATYKGEPIQASYSSSSGGHTDNSENVWSSAVPYLKGVKEINETSVTPWTRTFSKSEIESLLAKEGTNIGNVTNMAISETASGGRVQKLEIIGTSGKKVLTKESIRTFFATSAGGSLSSRMFTINGSGVSAVSAAPSEIYVIGSDNKTWAMSDEVYVKGSSGKATVSDGILYSKSKSGTTVYNGKLTSGATASLGNADFTIVGYGAGHGVGLSQHGANGMAKLGYTYDQILKYYYTGIDIQ